MVKMDKVMKTKIYIWAILSVCLAIVSCKKTELNISDDSTASTVKLVPISFTASQSTDGVDEDTKVALSGLSFIWEENDEIAIFDDINPATHHIFTATTDGATTSFNGLVSEGATKFFAVYPASAADNCDMTGWVDGDYTYWGKMNVTIPSEQKALPGTFDPNAAVLVAATDSDSKNLGFRIPFTLAKFTVDYDDICSITFSSGKNMTGSLNINMRNNGNIGTGDGTGEKLKTLKIIPADGNPFVKGATYYAVMRYRTGSNAYTDFTATLGNSSYGYAEKTATASVAMERAKTHSLGNFSGLTFTVDRYRAYQDGADVVLAGKTYNKATDGDAVLLDQEQTIQDSRLTAKIHFVKAGENYTSSSLTITRDIVIASTDPGNRAAITRTSATKLRIGSLSVDGILYNLSSSYTGTNLFNNGGTTSHFDRLAFSKCAIIANNTKTKYIYATYTNSSAPTDNRTEYAVKEIEFDNCLISTSGTLTQLVVPQSSHSAANQFEKFTFNNNVIYSSTGGNVKLQLFAFTGTSPSTGWNNSAEIKNNLFYNVANNGALYRNYNMASFHFDNNILFAVDGADAGGDAKVFHLGVANSDSYLGDHSSNSNFAYGALANSKIWKIADNKFVTNTSLVNPTLIESNPIDASTDVATGKFVLTSTYSAYGPQPMPIPM